MKYINNICDGCGRVFTEEDDIVVCPECATPQHRECYEKDDRCVNAHLHSDSFEWKSSVSAEKQDDKAEEKEEAAAEGSPCPNCGYRNPKGTKICKNCSMKLVVFGIDLADAIDEAKEENEEGKEEKKELFTDNTEKYQPPFTLGHGEGFEEEPVKPEEASDGQSVTPDPEVLGQTVAQYLASSSYDAYQQSFVGGVKVKLLHALIGSNAYKYVEKFRRLDSGSKISFNWAAFLFSPYWFFYRKLYKPGIIFMTLFLILSIVITPSYSEFTELLMPFIENPDALLSMSEEALLEFSVKLSQASMPVYAFSFVALALHLLSGFLANTLYKSYIIKTAKDVIAAKTNTRATEIIAKCGGISLGALLLSFLAEQIIGLIISNLMF